MTKAAYDNHVARDEFHPDPRVAAFYADANADNFARRVYTDTIKHLEGIADRGAKEQNLLDETRSLLADVEQRIKDRDPIEHPED